MDQKKVEAMVQGELFKRRRNEIPDAERVLALQEKLYQKAKQEPKYVFYVLYDKMFILYMLREAWRTVRTNGGAPGVDGFTIEDVEKYGIDRYLTELGEDLRKQTYQPQAVKRVMIEKENGGERPLGIPTVRDRIAQTVCKMILEPIFEADFEDYSYGFRPDLSTKDAMKGIKENLREGKTAVLDADLSKYFDRIPHDKLQIALKQRIADPRILKLINKWLKVSVDRIVNNPLSLFGKMGVAIVRYCDDFVLMGRTLPVEITERLKTLLTRMGLTLNETKTRQLDARKESFNFLGFTIRYDKDLKGRNTRYWNIMPSKKSEKKIRGKVNEYLKTHGHYKAEDVAKGLNSITRGWLNNFDIKGVSYPAKSKKRLRFYLYNSLNRYYRRKSQRKCKLYGHNAFEAMVTRFGLIDPTKYASLQTHL
jgi:hypothetical protein